MAKPPLFLVFLVINFLFSTQIVRVRATWCVARSDASEQSLQSALDYACYSGADCAPILANGLCYLPNTLQAHASYAFNGFYQRMNRAPGACDFAGTATIAKTDPSYGSCVYPASPSTAGGSTTTPSTPGGGTTGGTTTPATTPILYPPPPGSANPFNGNGGTTPRVGPDIPDSETSNASSKLSNLVPAFIMLLFLHIFQLL
ncbi:hypothetical protein K7X08_010679 [Anisodus acutangulus]|uniref:X8 domain-containing protein n=2 Tax=Anisodus TaxID=243963 RepID=A0A9Q1LYK9_9SOLA|nr:hypothetical protein K7X08_010679 [Anisodus acutangulus]KAK4356848.1 hypothetical protein RND71_022458 [Anisodus tanguticus]